MRHPAKFSEALLDEIAKHLGTGWRVLDPFAGTGRIHKLYPSVETYGVEIEPEWATLHPRTIVGDALALPFNDESFDCIATSPTYGNRMADSHNARDGSRRMTYTHVLGRRLHENNSGALQWGEKYQSFHREAWAEAIRVLKPGGGFILNVSDHIRAGKRQYVTRWHLSTLFELGLELVSHHRIETPRMKNGQNAHLRIPYETVTVLEKP